MASQAVRSGLRVALVDQGPTGGTCLNNGCIPSKMLIYPADVIRTIQDARAVGVHASIDKIDFPNIMSRMHKVVDRTRTNLEEAIAAKENLTYYQEKAEFIGDYLLKVGERTITASKVCNRHRRPLAGPSHPRTGGDGLSGQCHSPPAGGAAQKPDHHRSGLHRLRIRTLLLGHGNGCHHFWAAARWCSKARTRKRQDWCKKCSPSTCG